MLLDLGFELRARHRAHELTDDAATLEDQEGRDRPHAVLLRDDLVVIDVHLRDLEAALVLVGEGVDRRCDLLAGATPDGPKIDERGNVRLEDLGFEVLIGELLDVRASHNRYLRGPLT